MSANAPKPVIEQGVVDEPAENTAPQPNQASGPASSATARPQASGSFQDAATGFVEGVGRRAWAYADARPHTVLYGFIGLVLAVLILVLGLWHTLVIAVFTGVGAMLGAMRDGEGGLSRLASRVFGSKR